MKLQQVRLQSHFKPQVERVAAQQLFSKLLSTHKVESLGQELGSGHIAKLPANPCRPNRKPTRFHGVETNPRGERQDSRFRVEDIPCPADSKAPIARGRFRL